MRTPNYWGGMILSDIDTAYDYESWLSSLLKRRLEKYSKKWYFFMGMEALMKSRKYSRNDFHLIPSDPLVSLPEEALYWQCLSLKSYKLKILEAEVMKYYRRHKTYPTHIFRI